MEIKGLLRSYVTIHDIAHLRQECHNSKSVIFWEKLLKVLKCYNFLWLHWWHNSSPVASFANCVMTLYLLKGHLQTFLSIRITQKCQILSCDTLIANERYIFNCFRRFRNIAKSDYLASSCLPVRLSIHPRGTTRLLLRGCLQNLIYEVFSKICRENSSFINIWQEQQILYINAHAHLL